MPDLADFRIDRTPTQPARGQGRPRGPWLLLALLVLALAATAYFLFWRRTEPPPRQAVAETEAPATPVDASPLGGQAEAIDVPPLNESDDVVRRLVAMLSSHPKVADWLATDGLIRNFTVVVENIASGATPARHLRPLKPSGPFVVTARSGSVRADPRSYERYTPLAEAVASVDAAACARVYATLKPRIDEAHRELGILDRSFDRTLERALRTLLDTPVPESDVALEPQGLGYAFADPKLESLSDAQKQLLRMGPRNARIVQDKLREIALALGVANLN